MATGSGTVSNQLWLETWVIGKTDFHQPTHDRFLDNNKGNIFGEKKSVFLPLCGKTLDIIWLYNHGHVVCGVELAEQAIQEFFREHNLEYDIEEIDKVGKLYKSKDGRLKLYVADMFDIKPELCGQFDIIFDSKAFVAINKEDRKKYVETILSLMKTDGQYYLAAIQYDSPDFQGPPHSTSMELLKSCYGERCTVELMENDDQVLKSPDDQVTSGPGFITTSTYANVRWHKMAFMSF